MEGHPNSIFYSFFVSRSPLKAMLSFGEENSSFNKLALHDGALFVPQLGCPGLKKNSAFKLLFCRYRKVYDFNEQHQELHALR